MASRAEPEYACVLAENLHQFSEQRKYICNTYVYVMQVWFVLQGFLTDRQNFTFINLEVRILFFVPIHIA